MGGLKREFYICFFNDIVKVDGGFNFVFFEGLDGWFMFKYFVIIVYFGILIVIGKMIVYLIV